MKTAEIKRLTVAIPLDIWKKVRRLEESGKVKSIKDAVIRGLKWLTTE